jgi:hypothetical protein
MPPARVEWATVEVAAKESSFEAPPLAVARTGEDGRVLVADMPSTELWVSATHPAWAVAQGTSTSALHGDTPPAQLRPCQAAHHAAGRRPPREQGHRRRPPAERCSSSWFPATTTRSATRSFRA